jgi:hypothetical protein
VVAPHPYADWQTVLDPLLAPGLRNHWKSHDFRELSDTRRPTPTAMHSS